MIEAGDLLIAPPSMRDHRFANSVIIVANHNTHVGTVGFCVNKTTEHTINDLTPDLELEDANLPFPLYWGGPVKQNGVWLLHDPDWYTENTLAVNHRWSLTSSRSMFYNFADGDTPKYFRFVHGMASWAPGQLEMEMRGEHPFDNASSWLTISNVDPEWCLEQDIDYLWENATDLAGKQAVDAWL